MSSPKLPFWRRLVKLSPPLLECLVVLVLLAVAYFVVRARLSAAPSRSVLKPYILCPCRC
jgi:hypothetical protein